MYRLHPCLLLLLLPLSAAQAATVDETALELRLLVDHLVESVLEDSPAIFDEVTCLDDLLHDQLLREQALGLVPDAEDPVLVEDRKDAARLAAYEFVERLLDKGQQVELVDVSRVELFDVTGEPDEMVSGEEEEDLAITAAGVLGVKMLSSPRPVDIDVRRLRDRWCLNSLSMQ